VKIKSIKTRNYISLPTLVQDSSQRVVLKHFVVFHANYIHGKCFSKVSLFYVKTFEAGNKERLDSKLPKYLALVTSLFSKKRFLAQFFC